MNTDQAIEELIEIRSIKSPFVSVRKEKFSIKENQAVKELVNSIRKHGLIQPIMVRPAQFGFEVVAGHRRLQACKLLRWKSIPCIVRILSDKTAFEIQLIENIQRKNLDPIEEAESFKKYIIDYGWGGVTHLADILSKSEQYVSSRIQLLRLPREILEVISQNNITISHAAELVNLSEKDQLVLKDAIINGGLTVQALREVATSTKKGKLAEDLIYTIMNKKNPEIATTRKIKLFKRSLVVLRMSLARIDSLIEDANIILNHKERVEFVSFMMQFRLKIHSMIDQNIKVIRALQKNPSN